MPGTEEDGAGLVEYYASWLDYRRWYLRLPGVQAAVRRHGQLAGSIASGVADIDTGVALTDRHLFRIASHSKTLTSTVILQLAEEGRLRLDDRVADHVPELASSPVGSRLLRELLSHGGGVIRDSEDGDFWQLFRDFPDRAQLIDVATADSATTLERNEHWKYSNIAYGLLGLVIEAVTGETFALQVASRLAGKLGVADLGGEYAPERASDYASGHGGLFATRTRSVLPLGATGALAAATGAYATAETLTAVYSALLPGQSVLLNADSQRVQRHPHWQVKGEESQYGLGLFLDRVAERDLFGHTGGYPGHATATFADPKSGWVVSALTNAIDGAAWSLGAAFFKLAGMAAKGEHSPAGADAARFTGRFVNLWGVADIALIGGRLWLLDPSEELPGDEPIPLEVVDDATLRVTGGRGGGSLGELMRYTFDEQGAIATVKADTSMRPFAVPD